MSKKDIQEMIYALRGFAHRNSWRAITNGQRMKYALQLYGMMSEVNMQIRVNGFSYDDFKW